LRQDWRPFARAGSREASKSLRLLFAPERRRLPGRASFWARPCFQRLRRLFLQLLRRSGFFVSCVQVVRIEGKGNMCYTKINCVIFGRRRKSRTGRSRRRFWKKSLAAAAIGLSSTLPAKARKNGERPQPRPFRFDVRVRPPQWRRAAPGGNSRLDPIAQAPGAAARAIWLGRFGAEAIAARTPATI